MIQGRRRHSNADAVAVSRIFSHSAVLTLVGTFAVLLSTSSSSVMGFVPTYQARTHNACIRPPSSSASSSRKLSHYSTSTKLHVSTSTDSIVDSITKATRQKQPMETPLERWFEDMSRSALDVATSASLPRAQQQDTVLMGTVPCGQNQIPVVERVARVRSHISPCFLSAVFLN